MPHAPLSQAFADLQASLSDALLNPARQMGGKAIPGDLQIDGNLHVDGTIESDNDVSGNPPQQG